MMSNIHVRPATAFKSRRRYESQFFGMAPLFYIAVCTLNYAHQYL
jgi:hypothetical protein